jgi:hypothetical protein
MAGKPNVSQAMRRKPDGADIYGVPANGGIFRAF